MEIYPRKLEAVKLIKERGVGYLQAARNLCTSVGHGQMKPEQWRSRGVTAAAGRCNEPFLT
jgi:hypothetical protein